MIEADRTELEGRGETPIALHVRECERCRSVAARLLAGEEELAGALSDLQPGSPVEDALAAVRTREPSGVGVGVGVGVGLAKHWRRAAALAIAAALGGVLFFPREAARNGGTDFGRPSIRVEPLPPVEAPTARNIVIFETADPTITVVWLQ